LVCCLESFSKPQSYINIYLFFLLILLDYISFPTFCYSMWSHTDWGRSLILNYFQAVIFILFLSNSFFPYWMVCNVFNTWGTLVHTYIAILGFPFLFLNLYFYPYSITILIGTTFML
jgi:hypothetical protein